MRKIEQYSVLEGKTPLSGPELSRRFLDIDGRLHLLEELKVSWEQAVVEVQNHGLERINGVIEPLLDLANDLVVQIQQELVSVQQEWDQTIAQEWQNILDGWAGVQGTLDGMQSSIDTISSDVASNQDAITAVVPVAPIILFNWQTNPDQYPVYKKDIRNSDGFGASNFYQYVFLGNNPGAGGYAMMYQQFSVPFSGYDLQLHFTYKMDAVSAGKNILWTFQAFKVSPQESVADTATSAEFGAILNSLPGSDRIAKTIVHAAPSTANETAVVAGGPLVIPSTMYEEGDLIFTRLFRY